MRGPRTSRTWLSATFVLVVLLIVGLIGASPLALDGFQGTRTHWERLSFIGQTYGAASAVLSVFALIGVVTTLIFQAHETRLAREEARRAAIGELLKMAMEDPDLDECWGPVPATHDARARKQQMYVNMILSEWQMSFETKALGEKRLRAISEEMFQGIVGREFWESAREVRLATTQTRRARRFHRILDEEYQHALDSPAQQPPRSRTEVEARVPARRWMWPLLVGLTAGAVAALPILNSMFARHRQRPG